MTDINVRYHL